MARQHPQLQACQASRLAEAGRQQRAAAGEQQSGQHQGQALLAAELLDAVGDPEQRRTEGRPQACTGTNGGEQRQGNAGPGVAAGPAAAHRQQQGCTEAGGGRFHPHAHPCQMGEQHQRQTPELRAQAQSLLHQQLRRSLLQGQRRGEPTAAAGGERPPGQPDQQRCRPEHQSRPPPGNTGSVQPEAALQIKAELREPLVGPLQHTQDQPQAEPDQQHPKGVVAQRHEPMPVRAISSTSAIERI